MVSVTWAFSLLSRGITYIRAWIRTAIDPWSSRISRIDFLYAHGENICFQSEEFIWDHSHNRDYLTKAQLTK